MKAILYIGAVLMTGASVYGFVDYKKSNHKLSNLYESEQQDDKNLKSAAVIAEKKQVIENLVPPAKTRVQMKVKRPVAPVKPVPSLEKIIARPDKTPASLEIPEQPVSPETAKIKENITGKKILVTKKRKTINRKMFSRAALDEKYLEKELKVKEPKKTKQ